MKSTSGPTIAFTCTNCSTDILVPAAYAGKSGKCRKCGAGLRIPGVSPTAGVQSHQPSTGLPPDPPALDTSPCPVCRKLIKSAATKCRFCGESLQTRKCPACGETIKNEAKKCKHCGEYLDNDAVRDGLFAELGDGSMALTPVAHIAPIVSPVRHAPPHRVRAVLNRHDGGEGILHWYFAPWKQYAVFAGRARRKEYWTFIFGNSVVVWTVILAVLTLGAGEPLEQRQVAIGLFVMIWAALTLLPALAVAVRRLHDVGRSGWSLLLVLIPMIGPLILLMFLLQDSHGFENQFGPDPKAGATNHGGMSYLAFAGIAGLAVAGVVGWNISSIGMDPFMGQAVRQLNVQIEEGAKQFNKQITQSLVSDAQKQYEFARDNGSPMEAYIAAGLWKAACLQAGNKEMYDIAVQFERLDAQRAGMPVP